MNNVPDGVLAHPSIQRLKRVARRLEDIAQNVVFIGGAIAPLLQTLPPFGESRPTKDIDGVIASLKYADIGPLYDALRARGFRQTPMDTNHVHRWQSSDDDAFDLMPAGAHLGGSGQTWDQLALDNRVEADLRDGVTIRHASAPAFLGLKWAAFNDRGAKDPYGSHDLEDILALLVSRPAIVSEILESRAGLRNFIIDQATAFLDREWVDDILAGHLNNAQEPFTTSQLARRTLEQLRASAKGD